MKDRKLKQVLSRGTSRRRKAYGKGEGVRMWWKYFVFIYENRTMKPIEIVLGGVG
jgi:hypothetical protein